MGLDFVDLNVRLEARFGIAPIPVAEWVRMSSDREPFDLTAGEVCSVVVAHLPVAPAGASAAEVAGRAEAAAPVEAPLPEGAGPNVLEYATPAGLLPRPALPGWRPEVWEAVRQEIAAALYVPVDAIKPESFLRRDLGMSW